MADIVNIRKSPYEEAMELMLSMRPQAVLIIVLDGDDQVQYIAPPNTSVYEIAGWLEATKQDLLNS
jgi:hypothetical protein